MKLSLVLPVYNAPGDVRVCLESLKASLADDRAGETGELVIIDDCSDKETNGMLRDFVRAWNVAPRLRLIEHGVNQGFLRSANEGLSLASGDVIVLLNSDTAVPSGFVSRVLRCFASDPAIGLASPVASHCGLFSIPMRPGLSGAEVDSMDARLKDWPPLYPTVILPDGFCFCVRKSALEQVGLFDEVFSPGYFEETDLGMRARRAGWKTVLIDNLYVYHKAQASFGPARNQDLIRRNEALFMRRWGEEFNALRAACPREEHKARLYRRVYSRRERIWRKCVRFLAQAVPFRETRRRIRRNYN